MRSSADYDPSGKGIKMRKESDAVSQAGIGALIWPICVILALFVGYFIGVNQGGEQASEWSQTHPPTPPPKNPHPTIAHVRDVDRSCERSHSPLIVVLS